MNLHIRSNWTANSQYYIDFDRGSVIHSKTSSRGQSNRFFNDHQLGGSMKYMTYPQANAFYKKNKTAELYLQYLRTLAIVQLGRGVNQASASYIRNHPRLFGRSLNTLDYPVSQNTTVGFVRSGLDRQKLVDYMSSIIRESIKFGQVAYVEEDKVQRKNIVLQSLRDIAFKSITAKSEE